MPAYISRYDLFNKSAWTINKTPRHNGDWMRTVHCTIKRVNPKHYTTRSTTLTVTHETPRSIHTDILNYHGKGIVWMSKGVLYYASSPHAMRTTARRLGYTRLFVYCKA